MTPAEVTNCTDDGRPLVSATQAAEIYGVQRKTVYAWRARGYLALRGIAEDGTELYDAAEVAAVKAAPRHRSRIAA